MYKKQRRKRSIELMNSILEDVQKTYFETEKRKEEAYAKVSAIGEKESSSESLQ